MKRIILDTNIYGFIAIDSERDKIRESLASSGLVIYGSPVIRKQLRKTPKGLVDGINLRVRLLELYHSITKDKELEADKSARETADAYYKAYREIGGITTRKKMEDDFIIVACASIHGLDIVFSEDNATMLNELARKAYAVVNTTLQKRTPRFVGYEEFKKEIRK